MPPRTLPDGSEFVEPIPCDRCDALAYFVLVIPDPDQPNVEIRTFQMSRMRASDGATR
jgi:hypothetical protein